MISNFLACVVLLKFLFCGCTKDRRRLREGDGSCTGLQ